ncbi:MAG: polysaccharide deacetylase family protein [Hyphomicrobium sp.]|jgi:peptidoglycan/xylan/chitin deacetylase (PgdA/CDA1 family)
MRRFSALCIGGFLLALCGGANTSHARDPQVETCATRSDVLGLSRIVEVDTAKGPIFGRGAHGGFDVLAEGEVVLTFDDGPLRPYTRAVLKALAQHCTKATFFMVGRMAAADPAMVREVAKAGHTIGAHTWSHAKLSSLTAEKAEEEIELGFSAVATAREAPIAPFFRFPYLRPNAGAVDYLKGRDVASFTIDVDSRDFRTRDPEEMQKNVLTQLAARHRGILLFHDIQPSTARGLPALLTELKRRGYKVVHMVPKDDLHTLPDYDARASTLLSRKMQAAKTPLADRALTWQQSQASEHEVLPWAAAPKNTQPASTGSTTIEPTTAPWYKQWLMP